MSRTAGLILSERSESKEKEAGSRGSGAELVSRLPYALLKNLFNSGVFDYDWELFAFRAASFASFFARIASFLFASSL